MSQSEQSNSSLLAGFVAGVASSAAVAIPLYFIQKREAAASERRLVILIQQQLKASTQAFSTMRELSQQNEELRNSFNSLQRQLATAPRTRAIDSVLDLAGQYSDVARSLASTKAKVLLTTEALPIPLTVEAVTTMHKKLFPEGYELAGHLRKAQVWIGGPETNASTAQYVPPPAEQVLSLLKYLLQEWNSGLKALKTASRVDQANSLASFHHRLVALHPFLDGNGILARLLLGLQIKFLRGNTTATLLTPGPNYYAALQLADKGQLSMLVRFVDDLQQS